MSLFYKIFAIVYKVFTVANEVRNDALGDAVKKNARVDIVIRGISFVADAILTAQAFDRSIWTSLVLSVAVFFMFFDYLAAYTLIKRGVIVGHWFTYLSEKKWTDRQLARISPRSRFLLKLSVLILSVIAFIFIKP